jgi:hypothetical protein
MTFVGKQQRLKASFPVARIESKAFALETLNLSSASRAHGSPRKVSGAAAFFESVSLSAALCNDHRSRELEQEERLS